MPNARTNIGSVDLRSIKRLVKNKVQTKDLRSPLIVQDGDVIFNMNMQEGVWKGCKTSVMASDHEGRNILKWILRKDFDDDAKEIIEGQLGEMCF